MSAGLRVPAWTVLIPAKPRALAKSRLDLDDEAREALTLAMLADVIVATRGAHQVARVVVASADPGVLGHAAALGAVAAPTAHESLNADLRSAIARIRREHPGDGLAVVVADLPCLAASDLDDVLTAAPVDGAAYVASLDDGTTMLLARDPAHLVPSFGADSARAHGRTCIDLTAMVGQGARIDVDTADALDAARAAGLGDRTAEWVRAHERAPTMPSSP